MIKAKLESQNKNADIKKLINVIDNPNTLKLTTSQAGLLRENALLSRLARVGNTDLQLLGAPHQ